MADYQKTVANIPLSWLSTARTLIQGGRKRRVNILNSVDGVLEAGEMLVVLGPPGRWVQVENEADRLVDVRHTSKL
jgi:ATP-binding cassette subfamily G (WHITE) protein 2 (PDR)